MPNMIANTMIDTAITQPTMYKAMHAILTGKSMANIDEIHVHNSHGIVGKSIGEIGFKEYKLLFIGLKREGDFLFNPASDFVVEPYDVLLVMGKKISIEYFKSLHEGDIDVKA
jgi:voltage-gated potassium channel